MWDMYLLSVAEVRGRDIDASREGRCKVADGRKGRHWSETQVAKVVSGQKRKSLMVASPGDLEKVSLEMTFLCMPIV